MFGKRYHLFSLFGFAIRLDASWFVLAFLVTWTLAIGYFPFAQPGLPRGIYWAMGIAGTIGLFASIVLHEVAHSIVARRHNMPMKGITLFIFGGVAEMDAEPPSARAEFNVAIVGPLASIAIGAILFLAERAIGLWPAPVDAVIGYLARLNFILAVFNMVPAFPLDGGRVLRAYLWRRSGDLTASTRTVSRVGSGFGLLLMALGITSFLFGGLVSGIWWFVLGLFLRGLASASYQQVLLRDALAGEKVRRFMRSDPIAVSPSISVKDLVEDYIYRHHHKLYPVMDSGRLAGCVSVDQVRKLPREEWESRLVSDVAAECGSSNTISPDTDALDALKLMRRTGTSRLLVVQKGELHGVLTLKDLLQFFALKVDLEG